MYGYENRDDCYRFGQEVTFHKPKKSIYEEDRNLLYADLLAEPSRCFLSKFGKKVPEGANYELIRLARRILEQADLSVDSVAADVKDIKEVCSRQQKATSKIKYSTLNPTNLIGVFRNFYYYAGLFFVGPKEQFKKNKKRKKKVKS